MQAMVVTYVQRQPEPRQSQNVSTLRARYLCNTRAKTSEGPHQPNMATLRDNISVLSHHEEIRTDPTNTKRYFGKCR